MPPPRLILISHHFPPDQAAGALRWQKLSQHAARRGWGVDAIRLDPASLPAVDASRVADLPEGVRTFSVATSVPPVEHLRNALFSIVSRLRSSSNPAPNGQLGTAPSREPSFRREDVTFAPWRPRSWLRGLESRLDYAKSGAWARSAAGLGERLFDPSRHRAVISCGPPHMAHEGARRLANATGLPLVMDLRDPWSLIDRLPEHLASPLWLIHARIYEQRCVQRAALVCMNNDSARQAMQSRYPDLADRIITVLNGYDEEVLPVVEPDGRFRIAYAGSVYLDRNPRALFRASARLIRELGLGPRDFGIEFMGRIEGVDGERPLLAIADEEGIEPFVTVHPPGTRDEAMRFLATASTLASLPQDSHLAIPSKIYEYMRFDAWLLALAEKGSATANLLEGTSADVVEPDDVDALTSLLRRRYADHEAGRRPAPIAADESLGRRAQADRLFDALERIL